MSKVLDVLDALITCLATELVDDLPCFVGIVHSGTPVSADYCSCGKGGCGMAWARVAGGFPTSTFPTPSNQSVDCTPILAVQFEVGVLRCAPTIKQGARPPSAAEHAAFAKTASDDLLAMWRTLTCCEIGGRKRALGQYQPTLQGDCGGGSWVATVQMVGR